MKQKKYKENELGEDFYKMPSWVRVAIFFAIILAPLLGILANFSLKAVVASKIQESLYGISSCPISFQKMQVDFFLPKIKFEDLTVSEGCHGFLAQSVVFNKIQVNFLFPQLFPLGFKVKIDGKIKKQELSFLLVAGVKSLEINLDGKQLILADLMNKFDSPVQLEGDFNLHLNTSMEHSGDLSQFQMSLYSDNFSIPAQQINGFEVGNIPLKRLKVEMGPLKHKKEKSIEITEMLIGKEGSPIESNFKGTITIQMQNMLESILNLKGELYFSDKFIEEFSFISLFLNQFPQKDGKFQVKLGGTLSSPSLIPP